ncbi:hypothetical protein C8T65DRAFT_728657, partial [Cerioporus squamosus]
MSTTRTTSPRSSCPRTPRTSLRLHAASTGDWSVKDGEGGQSVELRAEGEPLPPVGEEEEEEREEERELRGKGRKKGREDTGGVGYMDADWRCADDLLVRKV